MKAIILCAGFGKRLLPYTKKYQKSMLPVHGKPVLEYILDGLIFAGFLDFIFVVNYKKEQIFAHFGDGSKWNIRIKYVQQQSLNGTGGAVLLCEDHIKNEHFFLTWGDILVEYNVYRDVFNLFKNEKCNYILTTNYTMDPYLGAAVIVKNDFLVEIIEKPPQGGTYYNLNNCGIFILSTRIFEVLKTLNPSSRGEIELPEAIRLGLSNNDWKVRVFKMEKGQFRGDFGDKESYEKLSQEKYWLKFLKSE